MNGDLLHIYNAVNSVKVSVESVKIRQEENHGMNKKDIDILFNQLNKLNSKLKCEVNEESIKGLYIHIKFIYNFLVVVVICGIGIGIWMKYIGGL